MNKKFDCNSEKSLSLDEIYISSEETELIKDVKEKEIKKYIRKEIDNFEKNFVILCDVFKNFCEQNKCVKLNCNLLCYSNLCYIPKIKAIIPDLSFIECYSQKSSSELDIKEVLKNSHISDFCKKFKISVDDNFILSNFILSKNDIDDFVSYLQNRKISCSKKKFNAFTICEDEGGLKFYQLDNRTFGEYGEKDSEIEILTFPIFYLDKSKKLSTSDILLRLIIEYSLSPDIFDSKEIKESFDYLNNFLKTLFKENQNKEDLVDFFNDRFQNKEDLVNFFYEQHIDHEFDYKSFLPELFNIASKNKIVVDDDVRKQFMDNILNSDIERASFEENDFKEYILEDQTYGHWDLWDYNDLVEANSKEYVKLFLPKCFYKRDPFYDYYKKRDYTVAIDFGTKSTVVCIRDKKGNISPKKISKSLSDPQKFDPYENPSVIEFIDFKSFTDAYNKKDGRPHTKWYDLTVSHEAFNDIRTKTEEKYTSFMVDLKSWCAKSKKGEIADRKYPIEDQNGNPHTFPPYLDIKNQKEPKDPVEYYAYYLGLYINRLSYNSIYSEYKMAFPIDFDEDVKENICSSFEKGIRKSLPTALLNDERFKRDLEKRLVHYDISEPAAYAIAALKEYGFRKKIIDKKENEIYYAIFDFGGGTTDFDFGVYSLNDGSDINFPPDAYPVTLTHFGPRGLNFGGEKLVKYLAFEVFKRNADVSFNGQGDVKFTAYDGCNDDEKEGYDFNIKPDSINAMMNMHTLMEKLRWAWEDPINNIKKDDEEQQENIKNIFDEDKDFKCFLFDENKKTKQFITLSLVDKNNNMISFQKLLAEKLNYAIGQFLNELKGVFKDAGKDLGNIKKFHIFLAGNSSKSILFNILLSKYFGEDYNKIDDCKIEDDILKSLLVPSDDSNKALQNFKQDIEEILKDVDSNKVDEVKKEWGNSNVQFCIYSPLRTSRAKKIIDYINRDNPKYNNRYYINDIDYINDIERPNGKTGVAFGLLWSEETRVVLLTNSFLFFVGRNVGYKFRVVLKKGSKKLVWSADYIAYITNKHTYRFRFYYTEDRSVGLSEEMDIESVKPNRKNIDIPEDIDKEKGDYIYIRPISKNEIEWRIARNRSELKDNDEIDYTHVIQLDED